MALPVDVINQFCETVVVKENRPTESTVMGTTVKYNGEICVKIDGSDQITPVSSTSVVKENQRVQVLIKNHQATITGNLSDPSASGTTVDKQGTKITEMDILIAGKVDTGELNAQIGRIDQLVSDNVTINKNLTATNATIKNLQADNATINGTLTANKAEIDNLKAKKIDAEVVEANYATIKNLEATNADIRNLNADYGTFKNLTAENFKATDANIKNLQTEKANIKDLETKYANIDFANIGEAAIRKLFSESGIIKDLVMQDGNVTGELVGVTIKGDLIEGNTIKADKLVIKGTDGLYYELNANGETVEANQTEYNSLNGSVIVAKSITASKINVSDLVAFGATIGGFHITDDSIYSGVKSSADNTTRGIFGNTDGEFAVGDANNYVRFYNIGTAEAPEYFLDISSSGVTFSALSSKVDSTKSNVDSLDNTTSTLGSSLQVLSDKLTSFVNGAVSSTLVTQTADGFSFNFEQFVNDIAKNSNEIGDVQNALDSDGKQLKALEDAVGSIDDTLKNQKSYINLTKDSSGNPLIELGASNSSFRVMITNTSIDFMDGSIRIAYISKDALNITSATVSKELKVGDVDGAGYIWQKRPNNHLGLRYVSS